MTSRFKGEIPEKPMRIQLEEKPMTLKIRRLSYALGAEVNGVDFSKPLDDGTFAEISSAFLEHCVLVFPSKKASEDSRPLLDFLRAHARRP